MKNFVFVASLLSFLTSPSQGTVPQFGPELQCAAEGGGGAICTVDPYLIPAEGGGGEPDFMPAEGGGGHYRIQPENLAKAAVEQAVIRATGFKGNLNWVTIAKLTDEEWKNLIDYTLANIEALGAPYADRLGTFVSKRGRNFFESADFVRIAAFECGWNNQCF